MENQATALYEVIRLIRPAFKHIAHSVENRSRLAGLSIGRRAVLERIYEQGPQTVPQIARGLLVERQYIQRSVNDLLSSNLVERQQNPRHKKSWLIALTDPGRTRFMILKQQEMAVLADMAAAFSRDDIAAAQGVMRALSDGFEALNNTETIVELNSDNLET